MIKTTPYGNRVAVGVPEGMQNTIATVNIPHNVVASITESHPARHHRATLTLEFFSKGEADDFALALEYMARELRK